MFKLIIIKSVLFCFVLHAQDAARVVDWNDYHIPEVGTRELLYRRENIGWMSVYDFTGNGRQEIGYLSPDRSEGWGFDIKEISRYLYAFPRMPVWHHTGSSVPSIHRLRGHHRYRWLAYGAAEYDGKAVLYDSRFMPVDTLSTVRGFDKIGTGQWDGGLMTAHTADWTGNGRLDIILPFSTGADEQPRGFYIYDLHEKTLKRAIELAPFLSFSHIADFEFNGIPDLVFSTAGASHGPRFGRLARDSSYVALLRPGMKEPLVLWNYGGESTWVYCMLADFTGDSVQDILAWGHLALAGSQSRSEIRLIEGKTLSTAASFSDPAPAAFHYIYLFNYNEYAKPSLLVFPKMAKSVYIIDYDHEKREFSRTYSLKSQWQCVFMAAHDINGDGDEELFIGQPDKKRIVITNSRLEPIGHFPVQSIRDLFRAHEIIDFYPLDTSTARVKQYAYLDSEGIWKLSLPVDDVFPGTFASGDQGCLMPFLLTWPVMTVLILFGLLITGRFRSHKNSLSSVIKSDRIGSVLLNPDGKILRVNDQFLEQADINPHSVRKQPLEKVLKQAGWEPLLNVYKRFANGSRDYQFEPLELGRGDSRRDLAVELFRCHHLHKPRCIEILLMDVSESNQTERLKAWAAMAQRVVHKTKTPLGTVMLALERMQRNCQQHFPDYSTTLDEQINPALLALNRVREQVNGFVKFSNLEESKKVIKDINHVVQDFCDSYAGTMPRGVKLVTEFETRPLPVYMDEEQLREALVNHFDNAVTAMKGEGRLFVSTMLESHPLEEYGNQGFAVIEIRDEGCGISPQGLERLFTPGYTTHEYGAGMGMIISKRIIEFHHGQIDIESQEGLGTAICIRLPITGENLHET